MRSLEVLFGRAADRLREDIAYVLGSRRSSAVWLITFVVALLVPWPYPFLVVLAGLFFDWLTWWLSGFERDV